MTSNVNVNVNVLYSIKQGLKINSVIMIIVYTKCTPKYYIMPLFLLTKGIYYKFSKYIVIVKKKKNLFTL